jgi:predicted RND superfamily exporter protein
MSLFKIPLTITTVAVSSLTIGLGIDYSIHIAYKFLEGKDSISSISRTGSALFGAALTTIAAFGLLSFSPLPQIRLFGMAISVGIVYSFILCAFILPILLQYWKSLRHFS